MSEGRSIHDVSNEEIFGALEANRRGQPVNQEVGDAIKAGVQSGDLTITEEKGEPGLGERIVGAAASAIIDELADTLKKSFRK